MKVAIIASRRRKWPKMDWVEDAFRNIGCETRRVTDVAGLSQASDECDVCLFEHKNAGLNWTGIVDASKVRRARWVQWWFDWIVDRQDLPLMKQPCLVDESGEPRGFLRVARCMDLVLVKEKDRLVEWQVAGIKADWLPQACPSWMMAVPEDIQPTFDVCLFGSGHGHHYRQRREDVLALAAAGFSILWAGDPFEFSHPSVTVQGFVAPEQLPTFLARGRVCLVVDAKHNIPGYHSDRIFLAAGAGATLLRRYTPGFGGPWSTYVSGADLVGKIAGILDGSLKLFAGAGPALRAAILTGHTYEHRARTILRLIGGATCSDQRLRASAAAAAAPAS